MGEQPVYTTKAHIFQIDSSNKKQWVPLSSTAVFVQFIYDNEKNVGRIISADNGKAILNSVLHSNVSFLKTSQKFGQWADPKAITVYGVGFPTESDLNRFAEKFRELREMVVTKTASQSGLNGGNGEVLSIRSNSTTSALSAISKNDHNSSSGTGWRLSTSVSMGAVSKQPAQTPNSLSASPSETHLLGKTASHVSHHTDFINATEPDITERPRGISGPPSSSNSHNIGNNINQTSSKLELEMGALRIENNRLRDMVKDANENIDDWKRKSSDYREEVHRLRKKVTELEISLGKNSERDSSAVDDLQRLVHSYKAKVVKLEDEQRQASERLQSLCVERDMFQSKYDEIVGATNSAKQHLADLHRTVLDKAEELTSLANKLANVL